MSGKGSGEGIIFVLIVILLMYMVVSGFQDRRGGAGQVSTSTVTRQVPASGNLTPVPEGRP